MNETPQVPAVESTPVPGDETVELQLTAEEQLFLLRADAERKARTQPAYDTYICRRSNRIDRMGTVTFAALVVAVTALTGWRMLLSEPAEAARATLVATSHVVAQAPAAKEPPTEAVVKVQNPFDPAEVFEFPATTSADDAQEAVSALLLQRAQEREEQGLIPRRGSAHRGHRIDADGPLSVFVTKVEPTSGGYEGTVSVRAAGTALE